MIRTTHDLREASQAAGHNAPKVNYRGLLAPR